MVVWKYEHITPDHLILQDLHEGTKIYVKSDWSVKVDQVFTIGITQLMKEIRDSVLRHGGYLDKLEVKHNSLLNRFEQ